jgi:5-methylcytosine-specific restriction endonuclease McrA
MEGKWVYLEHHVAMDQPGVYHLKLYGENENGVEVQFTMDHIIPRGKGGKDSLRNIQPMCFDCNQHKGNKLIYVPKKRIKRHVIAST